jgi:hypothetical protein
MNGERAQPHNDSNEQKARGALNPFEFYLDDLRIDVHLGQQLSRALCKQLSVKFSLLCLNRRTRHTDKLKLHLAARERPVIESAEVPTLWLLLNSLLGLGGVGIGVAAFVYRRHKA